MTGDEDDFLDSLLEDRFVHTPGGVEIPLCIRLGGVLCTCTLSKTHIHTRAHNLVQHTHSAGRDHELCGASGVRQLRIPWRRTERPVQLGGR